MSRAPAWVMLVTIATTACAADPKKEYDIVARQRKEVVVASEVKGPVFTKRTTTKMVVAAMKTVRINPAKTAVVVCDMWDDHWCKSAATRCAELARKADPVLTACREQGMIIIHCPSDCMKFYAAHPARRRMLAVKNADPPQAKDLPNPPLPVDDSDGGCDDEKPARPFKAWTRQHAAITIDADRDYITDNGGEVYSLMAEKQIDTLLVMGVHTNMCVLNRTFAIKQMVKWGKTVYLVRDLTDAMYNPKMKPMVSHQEGTELIIEHIERYWCPTIDSRQLVRK